MSRRAKSGIKVLLVYFILFTGIGLYVFYRIFNSLEPYSRFGFTMALLEPLSYVLSSAFGGSIVNYVVGKRAVSKASREEVRKLAVAWVAILLLTAGFIPSIIGFAYAAAVKGTSFVALIGETFWRLTMPFVLIVVLIIVLLLFFIAVWWWGDDVLDLIRSFCPWLYMKLTPTSLSST